MELNLHYLTRADGTRVAVQIPIEEWEAYQAAYKRNENRLAGQRALRAEADKPDKAGGGQPSLFSLE